MNSPKLLLIGHFPECALTSGKMYESAGWNQDMTEVKVVNDSGRVVSIPYTDDTVEVIPTSRAA